MALLLRMKLPPQEVRATLIGYFVVIDGFLLLNFSLQGGAGFDYLATVSAAAVVSPSF